MLTLRKRARTTTFVARTRSVSSPVAKSILRDAIAATRQTQIAPRWPAISAKHDCMRRQQSRRTGMAKQEDYFGRKATCFR